MIKFGMKAKIINGEGEGRVGTLAGIRTDKYIYYIIDLGNILVKKLREEFKVYYE